MVMVMSCCYLLAKIGAVGQSPSLLGRMQSSWQVCSVAWLNWRASMLCHARV